MSIFNGRSVLGWLFLLLIPFSAAHAQESTPYSSFGLGLINDGDFVPSGMMGGIGAAYRSKWNINFSNPASYSGLSFTTFEAGMEGYTMNRSTTNSSSSIGGANLKYLAMAFPANPYWTTSFGLVPFSSREFFSSDSAVFGSQRGHKEFEGDGDLYRLYWGNSFTYKQFNIGVNIGYLFGKMSYNSLAYPLDNDGVTPDYTSYTTWYTNNLRAKSFFWNIGAQFYDVYYNSDSTRGIKLTIGVSGNPSYKLGSRSQLDEAYYSIASGVLATRSEFQNLGDFFEDVLYNYPTSVDTLTKTDGQKVSVKIPGNIRIGITLGDIKNRWYGGLDFNYQPWAKYTGYADNNSSLRNSWRFSGGLQFCPKRELNAKFFSKMVYSTGFYVKQTNIDVEGQSINEFGINLGFSVPMRRVLRQTPYLIHPFHIGIEGGSRGTTQNNLIKENFIRFKLGITFPDDWFTKRKYY